MVKIAAITSFPIEYLDLCAKEMIASFDAFWPEDVDLLINLDRLPEPQFEQVRQTIVSLGKTNRQLYIQNEWEPDQVAFFERHKDAQEPNDYRFQFKRFAHKVFAVHAAKNFCTQQGYDYLIWLDADVITTRPVSHDDLKELLPSEQQYISYLGRKDAPHSECGWVAYDLKDGEASFVIDKCMEFYTTDGVLQLPGWTDCDVLDAVLSMDKSDKKKNLSQDLPGWHVWPISPLGKFMEHRKGARKVSKTLEKELPKGVSTPKNGVHQVDTQNFRVKTKNCVDKEVIRSQIKENLGIIRNWVPFCQPHNESVVIASAGPSLNPHDLRPWVEKGTKIVCVKHAIDRLKDWGIKPWACVLLDPRPHVEGFVKSPDKDVIYFVASMVHPSVTKTLIDAGCTVVGYHALVGAEENKVLHNKEMMVSGGSATATRSIALLSDWLGFKDFHIYGMDLCHFEKPDFNVKNEDGNPKHMELTMNTPSMNNKQVSRTFWTEGQFLAQAQEVHDLYKSNQGFKIRIYGPGLAAWQYDNWLLYEEWAKDYKKRIDERQARGFDLNGWTTAVR